MKCSIGQSINSKHVTETTLETVFDLMINDPRTKKLSEQILVAVKNKDKESENKLKAQLMYFVASTFSNNERKNENLIESLFYIFDVDSVPAERLDNLIKEISADDRTFFAFRSPSGEGVKIATKLSKAITNPYEHSCVYKLHAEVLSEKYSIPFDNTSDAARACYIPHNDKYYYNENAKAIDVDYYLNLKPKAEKNTGKSVAKSFKPTGKQSDLLTITSILSGLTEINKSFEYNDWISICMAICNTVGEPGREPFINYSISVDDNDTKESVNKVYDSCLSSANGSNTIGTLCHFAKKSGISYKSEHGHRNMNAKNILSVFTIDKSGLIVDYPNLKEFLTENGFKKIRTTDTNFTLVLDKDGVLEWYDPNMLYEFIEKSVTELPPETTFKPDSDSEVYFKIADLKRAVVECVGRNCLDKLTLQLSNFEYNEFRSKKGKSTFFFQNGAVEVDKNGYKLLDFGHCLNGSQIWVKDIIKSNFKFTDSTGMFEKFSYACVQEDGKTKRNESIIVDQNNKQFDHLKRSIGMLTCDAFMPSEQRLFIFSDDRQISQIGNEANGRSGKDLVGNGIRKMRPNSEKICGKGIDSSNRFALQSVPIGAKLLHITDIKANFNIEWFFPKVTDTMEIERKNQPTYIVKQENLPRILLTSNYVLNTTSGGSAISRCIEVPFHDRYSAEYQPKNDFGCDFFSDWDEQEYNCFYSFMIRCATEFHKNGVERLEDSDNIRYQRLAAAYHTSLIDWLMPENYPIGKISPKIKIGKAIDKKALYESFQEETGELSITKTTFTRFLKAYAKSCDLTVKEEHTGSHYMITFNKKVEPSAPATTEALPVIQPIKPLENQPVHEPEVPHPWYAPKPGESRESISRNQRLTKKAYFKTRPAAPNESAFDD